ncbi:hypothetical protein K438DRAFT_1757303 [Mycena galopus ATCC 62051]|nr:hypothetical protein K438DRAFT_1757303 [Mycena galopus ATCC 62051]
MSLHWSLLVKLPAELLHSHRILVPPPAANTRELKRQRIQHLEHRARMLADNFGIISCRGGAGYHVTKARAFALLSHIGLAALKPPVTVVRFTSALTPVNGWMHHTIAVHVPSPVSPSCTESTASPILRAADSSLGFGMVLILANCKDCPKEVFVQQ